MFTTNLTEADGPFQLVIWTFGVRNIIINHSPTNNLTFPGYEDRIIFFPSTASLELRDLTVGDGGEYSVSVFPDKEGTIKLDIYVPVSSVKVTPQSADLVEFSSFSLTCSSSGSSLSFIWMNGSSEVTASDRVQITDGGSTLTVVNVTRYDEQSYICHVFNHFSEGFSDPVNILVSYGPENTNMSMSPSQDSYEEGSEVSLSCSADSRPSAQFSWFLNGNKLPDSGPEFTLMNIQFSQRGDYSCQAFNKKKFLYSVTTKTIINISSTEQIIEGSSVTLTCEASGFSPSREWKKDGSNLISDRVQLSNGSSTLRVLNLTRFDSGPYRCSLSNPVSNGTSNAENVTVSYGPDNMALTVNGQETTSFAAGSNLSMLCSAESNPAAQLQWAFKGELVNSTGTWLKLINVSENQTGSYSCLAFNNNTGKYNNITRFITISSMFNISDVEKTDHLSNLTGPVQNIQWWKDDQLISPNSTATSADNRTLTFNAVQRSDEGKYVCKAFNAVSNMSSSLFQVTVYYGPEKVNISGPNLKKTGDNVTLSCQAESNPPSLFMWYFKDAVVSNMSTFNSPPLTKELSGQYICVAFNNITNLKSNVSINLSVIDPIVNVTITTNKIPVIENELHELTCEVTGDVDEIHWMAKWAELKEDNTTVFHMNNKTVTFIPVDIDDAGTYHCTAVNVFGNMTSRAYNLVVNYGPRMTTVHGPTAAKAGASVNLSCTADSNPESSFRWYFNDAVVSNMSQFTTPPLSKELRGQYTCMVFNSVTNKTSNASLMLSVIEPIANVQVQPMNSAVEGRSYNLTCGATGPVDGVYWMKDSKPLQAGSRIIFLMNNKTLSFMPADRSDAGNYQCVASNAVENMTSNPYILTVNYGPDMVNVTGPSVVKTGQSVSLSCSAASAPMSHFTWHFGGSVVANTSEYVTPPLTLSMSGTYVCTAFNNVTNQNRTGYLNLSVVGKTRVNLSYLFYLIFPLMYGIESFN
uniref:Ig-like domain-containing protein n=1 Tax=Oryzias latipes TaxID=8090 RepID=A0A3P9HGJ3_ORYLA